MKIIRLNISKACAYLSISILFVSLIGLLACYPSLKREIESPEQALIQIRFFYPKFNDDMEVGSLAQAIKRNLEYLDRLDPDHIFYYGPHSFTCQQVRDSQEAFLDLFLESHDLKELNRKIKRDFLIYRTAGRVGNRSVLFTGYFEPTYEASLTSNEEFKYPLYKKPDNLIQINLSLFHKKFKGSTITARIDGEKVLPYYSRQQIEKEKRLEGRGLEIAWLKDPVDVAFLQIQGSGRLSLPDGKILSVGYRASNGRPYKSIGRYLLDKKCMIKEEMSMQGIRKYLSGHPEIVDEVLNHNPSYVFFRVQENGPLGNISVPLTAGRSVALSSRLFPKGALCFISSEKPVVDDNGEIKEWIKFSRFVMNQDTGGAITGTGRADIFWGNDQYAELAAGHMQHEGQLYVLIKRGSDFKN